MQAIENINEALDLAEAGDTAGAEAKAEEAQANIEAMKAEFDEAAQQQGTNAGERLEAEGGGEGPSITFSTFIWMQLQKLGEIKQNLAQIEPTRALAMTITKIDEATLWLSTEMTEAPEIPGPPPSAGGGIWTPELVVVGENGEEQPVRAGSETGGDAA